MDSVTLLPVLQFSDGLNLLEEVGVFVLKCFTPDLSGVFLTNHKFGINSSRKNVNNFCATEIRYFYQRK